MPLIILGVLVFGGLLALSEIRRNKKTRTAAASKANGTASVIYLPTDLELEKRRRNII